jgi:hypothetical protein
MNRRLALLLVLLLAPFAACRKGGDPVLATIRGLEAAVDARDADAAGELLAASYADAEHADRNAALLAIRRYFSAYESISASFSGLEIERKPDLARAVFTATFDGSPRKLGSLDALLPRTAKVRFEMNLVPEDGRWRVAWAGWRLEERQESP